MNSSGHSCMRMVLVRHGRTPANVTGALDTGLPGLPLDEVGVAQARNLARRWNEQVGPWPRVVAVSPLLRTRMTAAPLIACAQPDVLIRYGIREISSGDIEMNADPFSVDRYHSTVASWVRGQLAQRMPGGENGHEVLMRALPVVAELLARTLHLGGETCAVIAHGSLIRHLTAALAPHVGADLLLGVKMGNTGTTLIEVDVDLIGRTPRELVGACRAVTWNGKDLDSSPQKPIQGF